MNHTAHRPPDWRTSLARQATRAAHHIGRRGAYLLFLAVVDVILGYGLTQPLPFGLTRDVVYAPFVTIMPLSWWAAWWYGAAALAAVAAVWHRAQLAAFPLAALLKSGWTAGYLIGWLDDLPAYNRGYQSAIIFAAFAFVTLIVSGWRENGR